MNNDDVAKVIKQIRLDNNLTQKDFAIKLGVTHQAVSKWENGKNIPDIAILNQISEEFNIDIKDILKGSFTKNNKNSLLKKIIIYVIISSILIIIGIFILNNEEELNLRLITTDARDFEISGCVVHNDKNSSIFISEIEYSGENNDDIFKEVDFILYEKNNNQLIEIDKKSIVNEENLVYSELIKEVSFNIANYDASCKTFDSNYLYIEVIALNSNDKTTIFQIPFTFTEDCVCELEQ